MREVDVVGVRVEMPSSQPIVLLREVGGERYLPIWIGAAEASAIAFAQQGMEPPRPLTHDLFASVIELLGHRLTQVRIVNLNEGVFEAVLVFDDKTEISARPSDSIALALRTGTPVFCADEILAEAGIPVPELDSADDEVEEEEEVERFREFLDHVSPEDFDKS
ncbi:bifunctional nuclease family protein [Kribbella deserti]|uniref:Bifunctional nuclease family protein n=1 Tax=Kribbella deserti TaxID=1926257 RepID=A0ABV6QLD2_9ACTN